MGRTVRWAEPADDLDRPMNPSHHDGILSEPIDLEPAPRGQPVRHPEVEAVMGLVVEHRASGTVGAIVALDRGAVIVNDRHHRDQRLALRPGAFDIEGKRCTLVPPRPSAPAAPGLTSSGSIRPADHRAKVARPSRIMVEGLHDAELLEKVWGDDLRAEAIVVEVLHGMDDLGEVVADFAPSPTRHLGILLDHLVAGSKEQRVASTIDHPHVLITGHPYVDVWAGIRPRAAGIDAWPEVPMGQPWKEGICHALGVTEETGRFWRQLLGRVDSYRDLETPLVGAVEALIDFVATDAP